MQHHCHWFASLFLMKDLAVIWLGSSQLFREPLMARWLDVTAEF